MSKLRIGVFGLWRGMTFVNILKDFDNAEVVALLDKDENRMNEAKKACCEDVKLCRDFDELLDCSLDGVLLCNHFHEHTEYAIRALERGVAVFSECTAAVTMKGCVELCETVEKTGGKYMLAENYPFSAALLEMERLQKEGSMGRILYAEGEYNHTATREGLQGLTPSKYHWRAYLPRTYYVTHSLGPLMHITKQNPVQVSAFAVHSKVLEEYDDFRHNVDAFAMMNCITEDGALFRFTGCAHMGSPSGYRVCGEYGSAETGRTLGGQVNLTYHSWCVPEGKTGSQTYTPTFASHNEAAAKTGHGGSDFWSVYNFIDYILNDNVPFFDVYRGCCMSAVGILGWRSCLENGKVYQIPDFKDADARNAWRDDDLTPFPDENGNTTLPCAVPWKK